MSIRVSCPFCNSSAVLPARPPTGRTACPRCGEVFPVTAAEEVDEPPTPAGPAAAPPSGPLPAARSLLVSLLLAAAVLGAGLYFYRPFGSSQPPPPPPADAHPPGTVPPAALAGLRYLPAGVNVAFAVQPAPLLVYADRTNADPTVLLAAPGVPVTFTAALDRLGLPLDRIDHVAGGLSVADDNLPGLTLVLRLRQPVADEAAFLRALRAEKKPKAGRVTYAVTLANLPLTMTQVDDRTYLFGLTDRDLSAADHPPEAPALPAELRAALATRLSPASFAWAATDAERWADKKLVGAVLKGYVRGAKDPKVKDRLTKLTLGRQTVVGVSLEPNPQLRIAVRTADAESATALRAYFAEKLAGEKAVVGGEGEWADADVAIDPKAGADTVRKLLPDR